MTRILVYYNLENNRIVLMQCQIHQVNLRRDQQGRLGASSAQVNL